MLLLGFFGVSVVVGCVLGVGWHFLDRWQESRERKQLEDVQNAE